jgi:hypothetical protein
VAEENCYQIALKKDEAEATYGAVLYQQLFRHQDQQPAD